MHTVAALAKPQRLTQTGSADTSPSDRNKNGASRPQRLTQTGSADTTEESALLISRISPQRLTQTGSADTLFLHAAGVAHETAEADADRIG